MIRSINGGRYLTVSSGQPAPTYMNPPAAALGVGSIRFNPGQQSLEVYDGASWLHIQNLNASVDVNSETAAVIEWARSKMHQEQQLEKLMVKHPGLKDLHEKFEMLKILCEQEEKEKDGA